jgi:putative transposase
VSGRGDALVKPGGPLVAKVSNWRRFLAADEDEATVERLRRHVRTGRPLGEPRFIARLETRLHRTLRKRPPGPKPKQPRR